MKAHNATGTVKQLAEIIGNILDGALMNPANVDQVSVAIATKHDLRRARTHTDIAMAAVRCSYFLAKHGDRETADSIIGLMEGRTIAAAR
jgi:hypothetical protein